MNTLRITEEIHKITQTVFTLCNHYYGYHYRYHHNYPPKQLSNSLPTGYFSLLPPASSETSSTGLPRARPSSDHHQGDLSSQERLVSPVRSAVNHRGRDTASLTAQDISPTKLSHSLPSWRKTARGRVCP